MKQQTFIQRFRASAYRPITREMIATALEQMANDLRQSYQADAVKGTETLTWNQAFEINGDAWLGNTPQEGLIHLVTNAPSDKEVQALERKRSK